VTGRTGAGLRPGPRAAPAEALHRRADKKPLASESRRHLDPGAERRRTMV